MTPLREAKGQAFVLAAGAGYALSETLDLELGVPIVMGSVAQPAGSYVDVAALGNPQLGVRSRFRRWQAGPQVIALSGTLELGAPLASHGHDLMPNRLLAVADGIEGRAHPEWFVPGVVPFTPSTALRWTSPKWTLQAELRLPLLVRVSAASLPPALAATRPLGFASVLGVEVRYRISRLLSLAAAAHLAVDAVAPVRHLPGVSPLQDFERLSVHFDWGSRAALVVDLQTAAAGELGGSTVSGGLRAAVRLP